MRVVVRLAWLVLFLGVCAGATPQRSTLGDNFGVGQERRLVGSGGAYFSSDPANPDPEKRFVLGFEVAVESKAVRLWLRKVEGRNVDTDMEAKYFTLSSCVLDDKRKCGKSSTPVPLRTVNVEIGGQAQPTAILIPSAAAPMTYQTKPYYDVYSPTFSPRLLIKVPNEAQQKALQSLLK